MSSRCIPSPCRWSTRDWKSIIMFYQAGKEYPSEDTGGRKKKMLLWYFPSGKHRRRWQKLFVCHVLLLCGKCCSSLPTLPGAHPVFEILNMRTVPLCSDETMMIHSFWNVLYVLFIWFFFSLIILLKWHAPLFLADFGFRPTQYVVIRGF